jgi:hypothetical protein
VEQPVAQDAPVFIGAPVQRVLLEDLVEDGLVDRADAADAEQDARQQH